jgi:Beta-lactamase
VWSLPRSCGPAGLITSSAADVLAFARLHLAGGVTQDGSRLLSEASIQAMAESQATLPATGSATDSWGIGWSRSTWDGRKVIGHDGSTIGQSAFLRLLPEDGLAVALLTNSGSARDLYEDLFREIFAELADVAVPCPPMPPAVPVDAAMAGADLRRHAGTYERTGVRLEVLVGEDGPVLRSTVLGLEAELTPEPVTELPMTPVGPGQYVVGTPGARTWSTAAFYELPTGEKYVFYRARSTPKVS